MFKKWEVLNLINSILKSRHFTLKSLLYSIMCLFSFMLVLLNFLKYLRSVLFPKIVVSVFVGLVLYLCQDLSYLMARSRFWFFFINSSVIFSVVGRKMISISIFDWSIVSSGP